MKITKDTIQHAVIGVATIAALFALLVVYQRFGWGWALAAGTTGMGVAYEANQWFRKEGVVSVKDAVATALPGWVALLIYYVSHI